jgi:hypothetical protein
MRHLRRQRVRLMRYRVLRGLLLRLLRDPVRRPHLLSVLLMQLQLLLVAARRPSAADRGADPAAAGTRAS